MQMCSDSARKLLKKIDADRAVLLAEERENSTYGYYNGEEPVIPAYSFADTTAKLAELDEKTVKIRHAINLFNATTVIDEETGMTIDAALIRLPILNRRKQALASMRSTPAKRRVSSMRGSVSEYSVRNYDVAEVEAEYEAVSAEIEKLQRGVDTKNITVMFDVDI